LFLFSFFFFPFSLFSFFHTVYRIYGKLLEVGDDLYLEILRVNFLLFSILF
jgi:hypothetical protein